MAKNLTGTSFQFMFRIEDIENSNQYKDYIFSLKHQALNIYEEERWIEDETIEGEIVDYFLFLRYEFEIDYSQYFEKDDALKIKDIRNALFRGKKTLFIPYLDRPEKYYQVKIVKEKRKLGRYVGANNPNKDYIIKFQTAKPIYEVDWEDPDNPALKPSGRRTTRII